MPRWLLPLQAHRPGFVASPGQPPARQRLCGRAVHPTGPVLPPEGLVLSDSGGLPALQCPLFLPLRQVSQRSVWCGWSGRESVPPPSQGSLNSLPFLLTPRAPLHPPSVPELGGGLCPSSRGRAAVDSGSGRSQAPPTHLARDCVRQEEGAWLSRLHKRACGLVASLAVGVTSPLWPGWGGGPVYQESK